METMGDFIKQIKDRFNVDTDYRLAQLLGVTRQAIHNQKIGRSKLVSEDTAFQIAALLGLNPSYVLLCLAVERAKNERIKRLWLNMAKGVSKTAASFLLGIMLLQASPIAEAASTLSVYYVKLIRRLQRFEDCARA